MTFDRAPSDADGLLVPTPRGDVALAHAQRLRDLAGELAETSTLLGDVRALLDGWSGDAADLVEAGRVDLVAELATTADDVAAAAAVLARFGGQAPAEAAAMHAARAAIERARAERAVHEAQGRYWTPALDDAEDRAWDRWDEAKLAYERLVGSVRSGVQRLVRSLPDRRPSAGDHVVGFAGRFAHDAVVAPALGAWGLLRGAVTDPAGAARAWWEEVVRVPHDLLHPGEAVADRVDAAFDGDGWRRGRYGEALGAVAALLTDRWLAGRPGRTGWDDDGAGYARWLDPPAGPPQTVDELLDRVDLERHEGGRRGHTLARHVGRSDAYLVDRLRLGTPLGGGTRGGVVGAASTFTDRRVAEDAVTQALRHFPGLVDDCARALPCPEIDFDAGRPVGRVVRLRRGEPVASESSRLRVVLEHRDGGAVIKTAFVLPDPRRPVEELVP